MPKRRSNKGTFGPLLLDAEDEYLREGATEDYNGYWIYKRQYIHRIISKPDKDLEVDHINRNPADNRRSNLRNVTRKENAWNMSPHYDNMYSNVRGVSFLTSGKRKKRWRVRVHQKTLGYYLTEQEAIKVAEDYHVAVSKGLDSQTAEVS